MLTIACKEGRIKASYARNMNIVSSPSFLLSSVDVQ